ncbi:MAG: hypothetical protein WCV67_19160 [Victivallaceae bacterium]|jgi:hypothetical protein
MLNYEEIIKSKILKAEGITRPELAVELQIDVRTVDRYVTSLIAQGVVERRMARRGPGRPLFQYFRTNRNLHFGAIQLTNGGIFGAVMDASGQLCSKISIDEFSLTTEIPATAVRKIAVLVNMLEEAAKAKLNALTLVFPREDRYSRFAVDVCRQAEEIMSILVFCESPISVHAYAFRKNHPEYRRILFLHFGFGLELAMIDGETLSSDNESLSEEFCQMPVGNNTLWHAVSMSTVMDNIAASQGITFYKAPVLRKLIVDGAPETRSIIDKTEGIIRYAVQKITTAAAPDVVVILALCDDAHIMSMAGIVSEQLKLHVNKREIDFRFLAETEEDRLPGLRAGALTADYLSWSKFVNGYPLPR